MQRLELSVGMLAFNIEDKRRAHLLIFAEELPALAKLYQVDSIKSSVT